MCSNEDILDPLCATGSSHNFKGNHVSDMAGIHRYVKSNKALKFIRWHPKRKKEDSLSTNLDCALEYFDKMIYLYPDENLKLLTINNCFTKVYDNWWVHQLEYEISPEKIYNNWPVDKSVPLDKIPRWVQREFLSLYLMDSWHDQTEWCHPNRWGHPRCYILMVSDLLYNLDDTLNNLKKFFNLKFTKSIDQIRSYHQKMLESQPHIDQDQLCYQIVNSVLTEQDFNWKELTLISESWIQWQLRNCGFEIECNNLDIFPTNSLQLRKITYPRLG